MIGGYPMAISYQKLFVLLQEKSIKKYHLRQQGIHANVMDKLIKNENVNVSTINRLCQILECQPCDIMEYVPDDETKS